MPKKGQQQGKPKKKTQAEWCDDLISYLEEHKGQGVKLATLEALFPKATALISKIKARGYPIRRVIDGDDAIYTLISSVEDTCKWCRGKGCLQCNGTGITPKVDVQGADNVQESVETDIHEEAQQVLWTPVDVGQNMEESTEVL